MIKIHAELNTLVVVTEGVTAAEVTARLAEVGLDSRKFAVVHEGNKTIYTSRIEEEPRDCDDCSERFSCTSPPDETYWGQA